MPWQLLVEFGADIAAKNDEGDTPLLEALMEKRFEVLLCTLGLPRLYRPCSTHLCWVLVVAPYSVQRPLALSDRAHSLPVVSK